MTYAVAMLLFSVAGFAAALRAAAAAGRAAVQSAGHGRGRARSRLQHRGQLRHQHQLAGLRRRDDDELSGADGRAHGAQLRLGGDRHRARHRADPRLRPALGADGRQFLGRSDPLHALRPAADLRSSSALVLVWQGVPQNLGAYVDATTLEGAKQTIAQGPVASQEVDQEARHQRRRLLQRQLRASVREPERAHQPRRRCARSSSIGAALTYTFGRMVGDAAPGLGDLRRDGRAVPRPASPSPTGPRARGNPAFAALRRRPGAERAAGRRQHGRQGGPLRHRQLGALRDRRRPTPPAARSTRMHDSFTPLGGLVPLVNIMLGEIIFGGVGSGLYGMLLFAILAVFVAGLMVGRTPEYLGKKIEAQGGQDGDARHPHPAAVDPRLHRARGGAAGRASPASTTPGPHGFSEILYAYTSAHRQQRQRLRRPHRQHALLQHRRSASRC